MLVVAYGTPASGHRTLVTGKLDPQNLLCLFQSAETELLPLEAELTTPGRYGLISLAG
jgi:hypothetical protein